MRRKRKLVPFLVLVMIERGRHKSVLWESEDTCVIDSARFSSSISVHTTRLRSSLEFLKRNGYLKDLTITHGNIKLTIAPKPRRFAEEAA